MTGYYVTFSSAMKLAKGKR